VDSSTWLPAFTGLAGIAIGGTLNFIFASTLDRRRHFDELRSKAYADFVRATAAIAIGQRDQDPETAADALAELTDAKVRITLYGSALWCERSPTSVAQINTWRRNPRNGHS
jgi:hypothetical protein